MISNYRNIENSYIENFSQTEDMGDHIVFRDEKLPDMYAFNCTLIKENIKTAEIESAVADMLDQARKKGQAFLKIILHPKLEINDRLIAHFSAMGFDIQTNLYMKLEHYKLESIEGNEDCVVVKACSGKEFEDGQMLDVKASIDAGMPEGFAVRKAFRKKEVFLQENGSLFSYLCYHRDTPVGKCELHMKYGYAKMEDFDVLESCRKRGFGTAIIRKMISDASTAGIKQIYLITDKDDTPREMYKKLGFEIIGEEAELLWSR